MRTARLLWAAPNSLLGLVLSVSFRHRRMTSGVLLCEGASWPRRIGWRYRAVALGHVVLCVDEIDDATLRHELAHVRQHERWGPLFLPLYALASLWALFRGRHLYRDNAFEVAARRET